MFGRKARLPIDINAEAMYDPDQKLKDEDQIERGRVNIACLLSHFNSIYPLHTHTDTKCTSSYTSHHHTLSYWVLHTIKSVAIRLVESGVHNGVRPLQRNTPGWIQIWSMEFRNIIARHVDQWTVKFNCLLVLVRGTSGTIQEGDVCWRDNIYPTVLTSHCDLATVHNLNP